VTQLLFLFLLLFRTSDVFARGTFQTVDVTGEGTSTVTVSGVQKAVSANLEGISKLYVDAASGGRGGTPNWGLGLGGGWGWAPNWGLKL